MMVQRMAEHRADAREHSGLMEVASLSLALDQVPGRNSPGERIRCLDTARGLSIVLVVIFHASIALNHLGALNPQVWLISDFFAAIRMPVFFAISGFLGARILRLGWKAVLTRRVLLLTYLYALWTALDLLANAPLGRPTGVHLWLTTLAWPNPVLWFIWALSGYFVVAKLCDRRLKWTALLLTTCLTIGVELKLPLASSPEHLKALTYASFFLAGAYLANGVVLIIRFWKVALLVSFSFYVVVFFAERWSYLTPHWQVLLPGAGIVAGLSGARLLDAIPILNSALAYLGRNTLTIYLAHTLFLKLLEPTCGTIMQWPGFQYWGLLVTVPAVIALSIAVRPLAEAIGGRWLYALPKFSRPLTRPHRKTALQRAVSR